MKDTGLAIIVATFFLGSAIMFGAADIASSGNNRNGASAVPALGFLVAGIVGLVRYVRAGRRKVG